MDYAKRYETLSRPFRSPRARRVLRACDRALVAVVAVGYVALLAWLLATGNRFLAKAFLVPAATFAVVSAMRAAIDASRPYEAERIDALIPKDTHGKSFPSRHMSSAVIIDCTLFQVSLTAGALGAVACILIAFTRIVGGVHYPKDIAAAVAVAALCGFIGFALVP